MIGPMNRIATFIVLFIVGFDLWALTSALPLTEAVREGWDRPVYWQIGLPLVFAAQAAVAMFSQEKITIAPLFVLIGHAVAMVFIAPWATQIGLLPLALIVIGVPVYLMLLLAAFIGRMVRRRTGLAS
jgi:hypothetical protein